MSSLLDIEKKLEKSDLDIQKYLMQQGNRNVVARIIHPIGQGAFYSERYYNEEGDSTHLMVYDCGSISLTKLKRELSSSFFYDEEIDLLFISHFDYDHVNGLKHLKEHCSIKKVVMPLISPADKWFYLFNLSSELQIILLNPQAFFGEDTTIVYVSPIINDPHTDDEGVPVIASGTRLQIPHHPDWCYIPFNYDEQARINALKKHLKNKILIEELEKGNVDYITEHREKIKEVYKKICSDGANKSSLLLYSGLVQGGSICKWWNGEVWNQYFDEVKYESACLYLGDTDLNQQVKGNQDILNDLYSRLGGLWGDIGMVQVPHHGSIHNFNDKILTMGKVPKCYFASYGEKNRFGHPSSKVLATIMKGNPFYGVTENRSSMVLELIYL